jgi:hypothetical protein
VERTHHILVAALSSILTAGCLASPLDGPREALGTAQQKALNPNALNPNALNPNALNPNALNPNALNPNALNPNALSSGALEAIQDPGSDGDLSRQLLKYTVSCALDATQSFNFSWTDADDVVHDETYTGLLGLAADWAMGALSSAGQQWVSACLASRVNWYGAEVILSSRGPSTLLGTTSGERSEYSHLEGAFYGNLFGESPAVHACHYAPDDSNSRSLYRDCAAGHVNADSSISACGVVELAGSCGDLCDTAVGEGLYYPGCGSSAYVITTYLP